MNGNATSAVALLHRAHGRERLKVAGLYRNQAFKHELEARLAARPGIVAVRASVITSNVLIRYEATRYERGMLAIVRRVVAKLRGAVTAAAADDAAAPPWHRLEADTVLRRLGVERTKGLSSATVKARRARAGANVLPQAEARPPMAILAQQFCSLPVALLGASAALSLATGGLADALVIGAVVLINAVIGFVTERGTDRVIHELGRVAPGRALVLRNGAAAALDPADVVPGDLLALLPGTPIAADARVVEAHALTVDESALTGESLPVAKDAAALGARAAPLAERRNMVYRATTVTGGSGLAVVVATGRATELGRIQTLVGETEAPETPLQKQLATLGRRLVACSAPLCGAMFLIGLARGQGFLPMMKSSIALFVAAIPEGLSAVATTLLALGVRALRRESILVRRLHAVEALGAVQTICLDKTGTLTVNRMTVVEVATATAHLQLASDTAIARSNEDLRRLVSLAVLCNDARYEHRGDAAVLNGSATEGALLGLARPAGLDIDELRRLRPKMQSAYRTEGRPYMATLHRAGEARLVALKGSPKDVLALCSEHCVDGVARALSADERAHIAAANAAMADRGLRVLGFAYRALAAGEAWDATRPAGLVWVGLVGIADPLRTGAAQVVGELKRAGVSTAMITGDQSRTAAAIGAELGLADDGALRVLEAAELEEMEREHLPALAAGVHVFARVSPSQKLHIVQALQRAGRVVAMTGDGINDGPALRTADVGVAMGSCGTEVARSVADVVLEKDELAALLVAIRHGRTTYDNLRKSIHFLLATNMSEIEVMLACSVVGAPAPLNPMQLLWINLVSDIFPGLALALDPPEPDVLERPPRDPAAPIAGRAEAKRLGLQATLISAGALGVYGLESLRAGPGPHAGSAAFMTLTCGQLLHALSARSERYGVFNPGGLRPNPLVAAATGCSLALQVAANFAPWLRRLLGTVPLGPVGLATCAAGAIVPFLANEALKLRTARSARKSAPWPSARAAAGPAPRPASRPASRAAPRRRSASLPAAVAIERGQ